MNPEVNALGLVETTVTMAGQEPAVVGGENVVIPFNISPETPAQPQGGEATPAGNEPPAGASPKEPEIKFDAKAIFGDTYDSVDKVKEDLKQVTELRTKISEYEKKIKDSEVKDPYLKSLLDWHKQGKDRETHDLVYFSDPEKMTPEQKVAFALQLETGLTAQEAEKVVRHRYKLGEEYDPELDPDVDVARTLLKADAKAAHDKIEGFRAKESEVAPEYDYQAQVKAWEPKVDATLNSLKEIELLDGIKYQLNAEAMADVKKHLELILGTEGVQMDVNDPQQVAELYEVAKAHVLAKQFNNILLWYRNEWEKNQIKKDSNVPAKQGSQQAPQVGQYDWMKSAPPLPY